MRYYPVSLDINGALCVVVGGGSVAERKIDGLLKAGARVKVISPEATKKISGLFAKGKVKLLKRAYKKGDLKGVRLVISATGLSGVNKAVATEAKRLRLFCNVVDEPELCGFIVPSVIDRGSLTIAISTSGKSPFFAKALRKEFEAMVGKEYAVFTELLGKVRTKLLKERLDYVKKEKVINRLIKSKALSYLKNKDTRSLDALLRRILGAGYTLKRLGLRITGAR